MRVKRFRANSVNEALAAVRKELGGDAVILKTTKIPKQGVLSCLRDEEVEVIAALESDSVHSTGDTKPEPAKAIGVNKETTKNNKKIKLWAKNISHSQEKKTKDTAQNIM